MEKTQQETDQGFMWQAIDQACLALNNDEVPVGALIVKNDEVIATSHNTTLVHCSAIAHAEMNVISRACQQVNNYRLIDCTLYVTLEPCTMCAGAIVNARIKRVVFGCFDRRFGAAGSCLNVLQSEWLNHQCQLETGVLSDHCAELLKDFFKNKRD